MTTSARFDTAFLVEATGGSPVGGPQGARVLTDSREEVRGALFVALAGPNHDGHDYVGDVLARGAGGAVVSQAWRTGPGAAVEGPLLVVEDTLQALQRLAARHRRRVPVPLVIVTGSNGKTTVKELLAAALAPAGRILKTSGNRNNHIGLPLTLLELDEGHVAAVVEAGMNHPGELRLLTGLAAPRVAVVTNVSAAHLKGVGSRAGVARAKAEIAEGLKADGMLVLPHGDPDLEAALSGYSGRRTTFGFAPEADWHPEDLAALPDGRYRFRLPAGVSLETPLVGRHMVLNLLAALAATAHLGALDLLRAVQGIAGAVPVPGRLTPIVLEGLTVLDDSYNANPASLAAALQVLRDWPGATRRIAVLGDMLELGGEAAALHRDSGAGAAFVDRLFVVGPLAGEIASGAREAGLDPARVEALPDAGAAARRVPAAMRPGDVVLVKGSRGVALEAVVRALVAAGKGTA